MVDRSHWKVIEDLFVDNPAQIIAMARVQKCTPGAFQTANSKRKMAKVTDQPRVLVLTGTWDNNASLLRLHIHSCKQIGMGFQVTKCFKLSNLSKLEVYLGEPGIGNSVQAFELSFPGDQMDTTLAFQVPDEDMLLQILAPLWHYVTPGLEDLSLQLGACLFWDIQAPAECRKFPVPEQKRPSLVTFPGNTMSLGVLFEDWISKHLDSELEKRLTSKHCGGDNQKEGSDHDEDGERLSLVSAKEERDLQALLDRFTFEGHDLADFQQRLNQELNGLEAANVQAILESDPNVASVRHSLNDALALLDDVNENLATFDTKLLVMREDIAAIEARNNRLELQTRNNGKLLKVLDSLLGKIQLPTSVELALRTQQFTHHNLDAIVKAGWELLDRLEASTENKAGDTNMKGIRPALASMDAVADQRQKFALMAKVYAKSASQFIGQELIRISNSALQSSEDMEVADCTAPDHTNLKAALDELMSLLHVVRSLSPDATEMLGQRYTQAFNMLLRRELRLFTSSLRHQVGTISDHTLSGLLYSSNDRKEDGRSQPSFSSLLSRSWHHRSAVEYEEDALQPCEAYERLLREWVPFLKKEINRCTDFLMLREKGLLSSPQALPASPSLDSRSLQIELPGGTTRVPKHSSLVSGGISAVEDLLAGINTDFFTIVAMVSRHQQVQAVAMLTTNLKWQAAVGDCTSYAPLQEILVQCGHRLLNNFEAFLDQTVSGINRYEPKSGLAHGDGVKATHILPFVSNFQGILAELESFQDVPEAFTGEDPQAEGEKEEEGSRGSESRSKEDNQYDHSSDDDRILAREDSLTIGSNERGQDDLGVRKQLHSGLSSFRRARGPEIRSKAINSRNRDKNRTNAILESGSSTGSPSSGTKRDLTEAQIPVALPEFRLITTIRDVVNPVYAILIRTIVGRIHHIAGLDAKHGTRLAMENFVLFVDILNDFAESNQVLAYFVKEVEAKKEKSLQGYIQQQLEYGKFWQLVEYSLALQELIAEVGPEEAPYQPGYQPADLRHLFATTFYHTEKRLSAMKARIAKHINHKPELVRLVWQRLQEWLVTSFATLLEEKDKMYTGINPPLTPSDLRILLSNVK